MVIIWVLNDELNRLFSNRKCRKSEGKSEHTNIRIRFTILTFGPMLNLRLVKLMPTGCGDVVGH